MSTQQPSLEELGLDAPATKPFGNAFDNYDSSKDEQPKTWDGLHIAAVPEPSSLMLMAAIGSIAVRFRHRRQA